MFGGMMGMAQGLNNISKMQAAQMESMTKMQGAQMENL